MGVVVIDDGGECRGVGFVAHVPLRGPEQPDVGQPAGTLGHAGETEVGGISQGPVANRIGPPFTGH